MEELSTEILVAIASFLLMVGGLAVWLRLLQSQMNRHEDHCHTRTTQIFKKIEKNGETIGKVEGEVKAINERGANMKETLDFLKRKAEKE